MNTFKIIFRFIYLLYKVFSENEFKTAMKLFAIVLINVFIIVAFKAYFLLDYRAESKERILKTDRNLTNGLLNTILKKYYNDKENIIEISEKKLIKSENFTNVVSKSSVRFRREAFNSSSRFIFDGIINDVKNGISNKIKDIKSQFNSQVNQITTVFIVLFVLIIVVSIFYVVGTVCMCKKLKKHIPKGKNISYIVPVH